MALKVMPWVVMTITTLIRGFLWCGSEVAPWGKGAVAWVNTCCPKESGGIGIPNLQLMGMALRMRWLWFARTDPQRTGLVSSFGMRHRKKTSLMLPSRSRFAMEGRPCSSQILGSRAAPSGRSPPTFGGRYLWGFDVLVGWYLGLGLGAWHHGPRRFRWSFSKSGSRTSW
jgi:hypothetical protein